MTTKNEEPKPVPVQSMHPRDFDLAVGNYWRERGNERFAAAQAIIDAAGITIHEAGDGK